MFAAQPVQCRHIVIPLIFADKTIIIEHLQRQLKHYVSRLQYLQMAIRFFAEHYGTHATFAKLNKATSAKVFLGKPAVSLAIMQFSGAISQEIGVVPPCLRVISSMFVICCALPLIIVYTIIIMIWDETRRLTNLEKHHLDFADAGLVLSNHYRLEFESIRNGEARRQTFAYVA